MTETKDCNGEILQQGDAVQLTKDLKVKGSPLNLKVGTSFKNIRLTDNPEEVECKEGKTTIVLKTCFLKKKKNKK
ncbi:MAG: PhnA protein [Candidatus Magasanikbacteria bacterium]|nr:PhnA protein [Candidatus Magasanikbacteria bacterium]NCS71980.1 PhnA protein [Candidatus Magasanikbacteria bacterium]